MNTLDITKLIVKKLDEKKANRIEVIEIGELTILSDYFVIASATNTTHVKSLIDEVEVELKKINKYPQRIEGYETANWVILDYIDVVVHIFYEETRDFYKLENLWGDGKKLELDEILGEI